MRNSWARSSRAGATRRHRTSAAPDARYIRPSPSGRLFYTAFYRAPRTLGFTLIATMVQSRHSQEKVLAGIILSAPRSCPRCRSRGFIGTLRRGVFPMRRQGADNGPTLPKRKEPRGYSPERSAEAMRRTTRASAVTLALGRAIFSPKVSVAGLAKRGAGGPEPALLTTAMGCSRTTRPAFVARRFPPPPVRRW